MESVDIKVLQKEMTSFQQILSKYEVTIQSVTNIVNKIDKIIAVQESKIETQEKSIEIIHIYQAILEEIKELQKSQKEHASEMSKRVAALEKWRYIVMGGAVALGFLLSKIPFESMF